MKPGVQTISFREVATPWELCRGVQEAGFQAVELWTRHLERWPEIPAMLQDHGIAIAGLGIARLGDPAEDAHWFDAAGALGAAYLCADFEASSFPSRVAETAALARAAGVSIGLHNHGAPHWLGNARMLDRFFQDAPEEFGLCLDTAWALDSREDPVAMIRRFDSRLLALHLKDFAFDQGRSPREVPLGNGGINLRAIIGELRSLPFDGWCMIETETPAVNPADALRRLESALSGNV